LAKKGDSRRKRKERLGHLPDPMGRLPRSPPFPNIGKNRDSCFQETMNSFSPKNEVPRTRHARASSLDTLRHRKRSKMIERAKNIGIYALIVCVFGLILFVDSF